MMDSKPPKSLQLQEARTLERTEDMMKLVAAAVLSTLTAPWKIRNTSCSDLNSLPTFL